MHHLGDLTDSVPDFMATDITSTTITLSWSPPTALVPISYEIDHRCRRLCESSFGDVESDTSVTSPYYSTDIAPYTICAYSLIGAYGAEIANLTTSYSATTLSVGKVFFLLLLLLSRVYSLYTCCYLFTQLLLYQSVLSHSHLWSQCQ